MARRPGRIALYWPSQNTLIEPGQFLLVWLDGEPDESSSAELHADFRVASTTGSIGLVAPFNGRSTLLDYLNYNVGADRSFGSYPDGRAGPRRSFHLPTPGATNNPAAPPLPIFINEWMAANSAFVADPADGNYDDWFELHNPNDVPLDLTGYSLTDDLAAVARWSIPAGTIIQPHGFLLVWADDDVDQNDPATPALHTNFKLSQDGEAIGLFAPDAQLVDSVQFTRQTNDVSQGRWPDGASPLHFMTTPTPAAPNRIVTNPPEIEVVAVRATPGHLAITWNSEAGRTYTVLFKDTLTAPTWSELGNVQATESFTSVTNALSGSARRFFRIQLQ